MLCVQEIWPLMLCQYNRSYTKRIFLLQMWSDGSYWLGKSFKIIDLWFIFNLDDTLCIAFSSQK